MMSRICVSFFLIAVQCPAQGTIVVKDTLSDTSNYIDEVPQTLTLASGPNGDISSTRVIVAFSPDSSGVLGSVQFALSFFGLDNVPVNEPSTDPMDLGFAFFTTFPGMSEAVDKVDETFDKINFDKENILGADAGYDVFEATLDLSDLGISVSAAKTYYISIHAFNTSPFELPHVHTSTNSGSVVGVEDDYYYFLLADSDPLVVSSYFSGNPMWACRIEMETDSVLLGDVNLDGEINLLDVAPFVDLLTQGNFLPEADVNQDGVVDLLDVAPFVDLLTGG